MNVNEFRDFCLSLKGVRENAPWSESQYQNLITFTVGGKWFSLLDIENKFTNLKCNPNMILELQDKYSGCFPAWHMNKTHWIGVRLESDVPDDEIKDMIRAAYRLIVNSLTSKVREELGL